MPGLANSSDKPSLGRAGKSPDSPCLPGLPGPQGAPGVPGNVNITVRFKSSAGSSFLRLKESSSATMLLTSFVE